MMFKRHLFTVIFVWLFLVVGCFGLLYTSSSDVSIAYQQLMSYSDQVKKEHLKDNVHSTRQTRQQVSKQILYKKGDERLQTRLTSTESDLIYSKGEGELVEHFKGLTCLMQEELLGAANREGEIVFSKEMAQQMVRQLKAQEAVYSYKSERLEAKEVEVKHYLLSGHLYPESLVGFHPFFQGRARSLQLSLFKEPTVQAQGFQAIIHDWGSEW
jgi:hypothetical protein